MSRCAERRGKDLGAGSRTARPPAQAVLAVKLAVAVVSLGLVSTPDAQACVCVESEYSARESFQRATLVFLGEVVFIAPEDFEEDLVTFMVEQAWKGESGIVTLSNHGHENCRIPVVVGLTQWRGRAECVRSLQEVEIPLPVDRHVASLRFGEGPIAGRDLRSGDDVLVLVLQNTGRCVVDVRLRSSIPGEFRSNALSRNGTVRLLPYRETLVVYSFEAKKRDRFGRPDTLVTVWSEAEYPAAP